MKRVSNTAVWLISYFHSKLQTSNFKLFFPCLYPVTRYVVFVATPDDVRIDTDSRPTLAQRVRRFLPHGMNRVNWMLGGWSIVVFAFLYIPIFILIIWSFNSAAFTSRWEGFTTKWYAAFWASSMQELRGWIGDEPKHVWAGAAKVVDWAGAENAQQVLSTIPSRIRGPIPRFVEALANSLFIGVIATASSVVLGTVSAWLTFKYKFPLRNALNTLVAVPMIVPEIIMGVSLLSFFSIVFIQMRAWGWNDVGLGYLTVIIGHITFTFPFVMVTIQARLAGIDPAMEEAAMDLGAPPAKAFWLVIVPYLLPAIISGALMAFTLSLDDFVVTFFLTTADAETLPIRIYQSVKGPPPMLHVVSTIMIGLTLLTVLAAEGFKRLNR